MSQVNCIYLDESFYHAPEDKMGEDAFAVIRKAMKKEDLVGLVVIYRREHTAGAHAARE